MRQSEQSGTMVEKAPSVIIVGEEFESSFSYDEASKVMVVRIPNVSAMNNWEISLVYH